MAEDNKRLAQEFYAAVSAGEFDRFDEFMTEDFVDHEEFPGLPSTREGVRQFFEMVRGAFPDLRMEVEETVAEGDRVAVRGRMTGTHRGEFMGVPPTGRSIDVPVMDMVAIRDGRASEHWGVTDTMRMLQQLGAVEGPAPA